MNLYPCLEDLICYLVQRVLAMCDLFAPPALAQETLGGLADALGEC
jgi:hypothetical protein